MQYFNSGDYSEFSVENTMNWSNAYGNPRPADLVHPVNGTTNMAINHYNEPVAWACDNFGQQTSGFDSSILNTPHSNSDHIYPRSNIIPPLLGSEEWPLAYADTNYFIPTPSMDAPNPNGAMLNKELSLDNQFQFSIAYDDIDSSSMEQQGGVYVNSNYYLHQHNQHHQHHQHHQHQHQHQHHQHQHQHQQQHQHQHQQQPYGLMNQTSNPLSFITAQNPFKLKGESQSQSTATTTAMHSNTAVSANISFAPAVKHPLSNSSSPDISDCAYTTSPLGRTHDYFSSLPKSRPVQRARTGTRRRLSPQTSVAAEVSLTKNEPIESIINGIAFLSFVYSVDRVAKTYTIRADIDSVDINSISSTFKSQNAIYPRAAVNREDYRGTRWEYESQCNIQGWKLAFLNLEELEGRRGVIQRAVDSFRNKKTNMRSRRVSRQVKVENGTLRKRRPKPRF
ncbi:hypothetical protein BDF14DRAFT_702744 [Spinellus fusiger]|nr:hypothetical protein BDF14DRAFT_702744 [Spinellus fusiger]